MTVTVEQISDRLSRWNDRWNENNLGWHINKVHPALLKHADKLIQDEVGTCPTGSVRWLFPLCGKTYDMAYLASQESTAQVIGVDGIRKALESFASEHQELEISESEHGHSDNYDSFAGKKITLLKGDFFALDQEEIGGQVDAVMDRGSLVAIDPSLRDEYIKIMSNVVKPGGKILLITVDRRAGEEEARKKGPPFSIDTDDVQRLYGEQPWVESVELLEEIDEFEGNPAKRERYEGLTSMFEMHFLITTKKKDATEE